MFNLKSFSIKAKLIFIFIVFKIIPLILLSSIGILSFLDLDSLLKKSSEEIIKKSQSSVKSTTDSAIADSITALDKKSQRILEEKTHIIAQNVAEFLEQRDEDLLYLSKQKINQKTLKDFYKRKNRDIYVHEEHVYDEQKNRWIPLYTSGPQKVSERAILVDNSKEFNKINPKDHKTISLPIYKEISFFSPNGLELLKISTIDPQLKDISKKTNTYCNAETYFEEALALKKDEIYVSQVIGEYIPSPIIGSFTKDAAAKAGIDFAPQNYAYAGIENPLGKQFEGIVRFVTPVYNDDTLQGYLSLALDHQHLMNFTDFVDPLSPTPLPIPNAIEGNYAFMWSHDFKAISHPRDYFIVGYDAKSGEMVPGWIDADLAREFAQSDIDNLNTFLKHTPLFLDQSLKKKPNIAQMKIGQVGLDCRYLNFAPQCQGWSQLTSEGGYGSFIIYWSNVWKLNTAASIPYYTGQYQNSKRGFGFVTMGANVNEFHKAATKTQENINAILEEEKINIKAQIYEITEIILENIKGQINRLVIITIILTVIIIYVAVYFSNSLSERIKNVLIGTEKIKNKEFGYEVNHDVNDEIGELTLSFNEMSHSIEQLTNSLQEQLYTDDLTKLPNRKAFWSDLKYYEYPTLYLIDIDQFKNINDYFGVDAGNFVLVRFAQITQKICHEEKMCLYRMGSDEYLILSEGQKNSQVRSKTVTKIKKLIEKENFKNEALNIEIKITFTCGISSGNGNLLEEADLALNEAKRRKLSHIEYSNVNPHMNKHKENILWKEKIAYAIKNDLVVPYFQQIINTKNTKDKKYEALIRILDEDKDNAISPYFFLDVAKETKLYPELTKIMIRKTFQKFHDIDANFSINLSIDDITNEDTTEYIFDQLEICNVKEKFTIELIETEEINDFEDIKPFIKKMKSIGVGFAIDDFGSGYSNFAYLLQIKPNCIKIDGSLVKNLTYQSTEYKIIDAIVKFAKSLDAQIVAEHVSSQNILKVLEDFDIDYMQGYYFSEPAKELS